MDVLTKERTTERVILVTSHNMNRLNEVVDMIMHVDNMKAEMMRTGG